MVHIKTKKGVIGILTGGGDCPGLNPAIRAVTIRAIREGYKVIGIRRGWAGTIDLVYGDSVSNGSPNKLANGFGILTTKCLPALCTTVTSVYATVTVAKDKEETNLAITVLTAAGKYRILFVKGNDMLKGELSVVDLDHDTPPLVSPKANPPSAEVVTGASDEIFRLGPLNTTIAANTPPATVSRICDWVNSINIPNKTAPAAP